MQLSSREVLPVLMQHETIRPERQLRIYDLQKERRVRFSEDRKPRLRGRLQE